MVNYHSEKFQVEGVGSPFMDGYGGLGLAVAWEPSDGSSSGRVTDCANR